MNRATIERIVQQQGHTATFRRVNERTIRVWAVNGRDGRSLGYLSSLEQMSESTFINWIRAAFARKAR